MKIIIIASVSSNRVIGRNGQLPWKIPEDLEHFKKTTMGHCLLMGRKTYESIGRILPGRLNIVVSNTLTDHKNDTDELRVIESPSKGVELARALNKDKLFICGGEAIYVEFIKVADEMLITEIDEHIEGDSFFPKFDMKDWKREEMGFVSDLKLVRYVRSSRKNLLS